MTTTQVSISQYAENYKKCSTAAIRKAVSNNKYQLLPNVKKAEKIGRNWVLTLFC